MESLILAEQGSTFSSFGVGFLAGFAFSVMVFLVFEVISQSKLRRKRNAMMLRGSNA